MNKEEYFIKQFSKSKYIGDDGAFINNYCYSMDAFFEDIHFKKEWMSLKQISYKAMIVNISDAVVMNAIPKYALLSVAIPNSYNENDLKLLAKGFKKAAKQYDIEIIGGDTVSCEKLNISITIISKTKKPIYRKDAKINDLVCFTGDLGSCKRDLNRLFENRKINKNSKFIKPKLKADFFYEISKYINSALDISDGLAFELQRVSKASKVGFEFFYDISKDSLTSGEEYEILFTFDEKNRKKIEKIAKKHNVKLNIFAKAIEGKYETKEKNHHF
ncbi:MAG: thiamine-phosphate kinase [Campylobacterota bacterium]